MQTREVIKNRNISNADISKIKESLQEILRKITNNEELSFSQENIYKNFKDSNNPEIKAIIESIEKSNIDLKAGKQLRETLGLLPGVNIPDSSVLSALKGMDLKAVFSGLNINAQKDLLNLLPMLVKLAGKDSSPGLLTDKEIKEVIKFAQDELKNNRDITKLTSSLKLLTEAGNGSEIVKNFIALKNSIIDGNAGLSWLMKDFTGEKKLSKKTTELAITNYGGGRYLEAFKRLNIDLTKDLNVPANIASLSKSLKEIGLPDTAISKLIEGLRTLTVFNDQTIDTLLNKEAYKPALDALFLRTLNKYLRDNDYSATDRQKILEQAAKTLKMDTNNQYIKSLFEEVAAETESVPNFEDLKNLAISAATQSINEGFGIPSIEDRAENPIPVPSPW